ncbi:hypothetical protein Vretimale_2164, partial [Volvox reticuliferus]
MTNLTQYEIEKLRIEETILSALNTSLQPAVAARTALGGAFPSAIFEYKDDGTLFVQGLDAAHRQNLEDALFELNLSLANQAVARGLPLMQYLHPDATHDGTTTLPRFLQICLELARPLLSEPIKDAEKAGGRRRLLDYEGWARLFEGLMEIGTIADCSDLFRLMEGGSSGVAAASRSTRAAMHGGSDGNLGHTEPNPDWDLGWAAVFCSEDFRREQGAKLALLRMSNMLFRRLSKAYDVRLCGRLLIFISRCYELNDKSGLNVVGALNSGLTLPVDEVEPGAVDSIGEQIDRRLYTCFWGLQAIFQNPAQVLQPAVYGKVMADMSLVLDEFAAIKNPVAATGPWVAARHPSNQIRPHLRDGGDAAEGMEVDNSGPGGGADAASSRSQVNEGGSGVGTRYLTSSKLFGLQVRDCTFRRHFLLQCLALLQYIEQPSKSDKSAIGQRPEGLEAMRTKLFSALSDTKEYGPDFAAAVRSVLEHEAHWVAWKHGTHLPPPPGSAGPAASPPASAAAGSAAGPGAASAAAGELCRDFTRPPAAPTKEVTSSSHGVGLLLNQCTSSQHAPFHFDKPLYILVDGEPLPLTRHRVCSVPVSPIWPMKAAYDPLAASPR